MDTNVDVGMFVCLCVSEAHERSSLRVCVCVFTVELGLASFLPVQGDEVPSPTNASLLWARQFESVCVCVFLRDT